MEVANRRLPDVRETIMRYLLLIYGEESTGTPDPAEAEKVMNEYWAYSNAIKDDERVVTDGPFAETREVLGGYYLIDVPDLDAAIDWAAKCPGAKYGSVELRPIMEFS
jgi:hypothetical protein